MAAPDSCPTASRSNNGRTRWCRKPCDARMETRARPRGCWACRATPSDTGCRKSALPTTPRRNPKDSSTKEDTKSHEGILSIIPLWNFVPFVVNSLALFRLQQHASHVIMLWRISHEEIDFRHQALQHLGRFYSFVVFDRGEQPRLSKFFLARILGFHYSVGKDDQPIARRKRDLCRLILHVGHDPERQAANIEAFDLSAGTAQDGVIMSRIDVIDRAVGRVVFRKKGGREA